MFIINCRESVNNYNQSALVIMDNLKEQVTSIDSLQPMDVPVNKPVKDF